MDIEPLLAKYKSSNFPYDQERNEFLCPAHNHMVYAETQPCQSKNVFHSEHHLYEYLGRSTCPLKPQHTKAKGNRRVRVGFELQRHRQQARDNLLSQQGLALRQLRCIEPETVFGNTKHNMGIRRFMLRGLKKVDVEWGLVCMAHNLQKLAIQ